LGREQLLGRIEGRRPCDDVSGVTKELQYAFESVLVVVEHKDADERQREILEVYTGVMAVPNALLKRWLARLSNDNVQGEYYLTDIVKHAVKDGAEALQWLSGDPPDGAPDLVRALVEHAEAVSAVARNEFIVTR